MPSVRGTIGSEWPSRAVKGPGPVNDGPGDKDQQLPLLWGAMTPATDVEAKAAVERFARLSEDEQAEIMARGQLIQSVEDLDSLSGEAAERLRPIIEGQAAER